MINKIKEYISRNKKGVITFILTNRLFISFIISYSKTYSSKVEY